MKSIFQRRPPVQHATQRSRLSAVAVAAATLLGPWAATPAAALACTWQPATGDWATIGNWSCGAVPGSGDSASIALGKLASITDPRSLLQLSNAGGVDIDSSVLTLVSGGSSTNTGTIHIGSGVTATLQIAQVFNNVGGTVNIGAGSALNQLSNSFSGGVINNAVGGLFTMGSGVSLSAATLQGGGSYAQTDNVNSTLSGLTLAAATTLSVGNNSTAFTNGTFTNNGTLSTTASGGFGSTLSLNGDAVFNGSGRITLNEEGTASIRDDFNGRVLTVGAAQTLQGAGLVGVGTTLRLNNAGTVSANVSGKNLTLTGGAATNTGTMQASGGGLLNIGNLVVTNAGGLITASGAGSTVTLNQGATLSGGTLTTAGGGVIRSADNVSARIGGGVTLSAGSTFTAGNNSNVYLGLGGNDTLTNNGDIRTSAAGGFGSALYLDGTVTLAGTGTVTLQDVNAQVRDDFNSRILNLGSGQTLQGNGNLGAGTTLHINNAGVITANQSGKTLTVQMSSGMTNTGTVRAENGGTLELISSSFIRNGGATIEATAGGTVALGNGATLYNGLLTGTGSFIQRDNVNSRLSGTQFGTLNGTNVSDALTIGSGSTVTVGNNSGLYLDGSIVNDGVIRTGAVGGFTSNVYVSTSGINTVSGSGRITLQDAQAGIRDDFNSRSFVNAAGHTIDGFGAVGGGTTIVLTNQGLITANVNAKTLTLSTSSPVANENILRAEGGGTLAINNTLVNNTNLITALDDSTVALGNASTIAGGTLTTAGSGVIRSIDGVNMRLSNLTLSADSSFLVGNNTNTLVNGVITNNGNIRGTSAGGTTSTIQVNTADGVTFNGGGTITLTAANDTVRDDFNSRTFTNGATHTIQGTGQVGAGSTLLLNNLGLITANVNAATLTLSTSQPVANAGILRAEGGGTLAINNTLVNNTNLITALADSTVALGNATTLVGGTLTTSGSGVIRSVDGVNMRLSGVTLSEASSFLVGNNTNTFVNGVITNNGDIRGTSAGGSVSSIQVNTTDGVTFNGGGTMTLTASNDVIRDDFNARALTNGVGHTIQGTGQLGAGSTLAVTNDGIIDANRSGGTLLVSTSRTTTTSATGVLRAENGGVLRFAGGTHTVQPGGLVQSLADSSVQVAAGASFSNLVNNTLSGGIWQANSVGGAAGLIDFEANNTTIAVNAADIYLVGPASQIQGRDATGVVKTLDQTLSSNLASLRLQQGRVFTASANGGNFINGNGALLELSGATFQSNNLTLADAGSTVSSFGTSALTTASPINGNGQVNVNNGTLSIAKGFNLAAGSAARVAAGATLDLAGATAASTVGTVTTSGALHLGAQNLNVIKDYDNSNFGTGNAFNARANVTGAGLIVGTNASQTVTGNVVAAGANTWTLNVGNVRGGTSRNLDFQIANNGTGADIRGALQTTGLSDTRLSGSGTAAGNFGPLAAGTATGNYGVTLNATSGGALAGQSLAVVSNFGNVATQTINLSGFATALAVGNTTPAGNPVTLANFRVGGTQPSLGFAAQNLTGGSGAEQLGIASVGSSGHFSAVNNLGAGFVAPGATFAGAVTASVAGGTVGVNSGSLTVNYTTNGQLIDPSFVTQAANTQVTPLQATGFLVAGGLATPSPVQVAAQRVGGSNGVSLTVANTTVAGGFSEDLNAAFSGFTGAASGAGSISGRLAGSNNTGVGAMTVSVDTSSSGSKSGMATLAYQTAGAVAGVSNGLGVAAAGSQAVLVNGNVYAPAVAQLGTPTVAFGIVRVGDSVAARTVSVANTASGALTDNLNASLGGAAAPFTAAGAVSVAAGASNNSGLTVALNTGTAGVFNSSAVVTFASHDAELSDLALGTANVALSAQVNNLASSVLAKASGAGTFSGGPTSYTLNFGSVVVGNAGGTAQLTLTNNATGPADALAGSFDLSALQGGDPFALGGFDSFSNLAAGASLEGLTVSFSGTTLGSFDRVVTLNRLSTNGSGPDLVLSAVQLHLQGSVVAVPEPGTWAMWLAGLVAIGSLVRRRSAAQA